MTENEIILKIVQGDLNQYRVLVERYQSTIFRTCLGFLHNKEDADDLTQEVFIQAYLALKNFRGDSSFSTWLYRIAVNAASNRTRKKSKDIILERLGTFFGNEKHKELLINRPDDQNPEDIIITEEHRVIVNKALDTLSEKQRIAIVLSKYDDLPQKEIAEIMNTTEGAVEALIQRAKINLRHTLSSLRKK